MDIDAYASAVALAELLRLQGEDAVAATSAPLNASIPNSLRKLEVQFAQNYKPSPDDIFSIVDISDPKYFDLGATPENVVAVIDHHLGFTDFWEEKLDNRARIEFIGAACTQVYELWQGAELLQQLSQPAATLLACGILDNTLNLRANITTKRDKAAYAALAKHAGLPDDWPKRYFSECQDAIERDIRGAIVTDTKPIQYPSLPYLVDAGQAALWDAKGFISLHKRTIRDVLGEGTAAWFMNFIDIGSGRSVFLCEDSQLKTWLEQILDVTFKGDTATANRLWLRKEIMRRAIEKEGSKL